MPTSTCRPWWTGCARTVLVTDASFLVAVLLDDGDLGARDRARLRGESLTAPELVDLEVLSVIRPITGDAPLTRAPGLRCRWEPFGVSG